MFYEPLLTPGLLGALDPMDGLTGGGPAFVDFAPGAMPEQMSMLPSARTPADEFQMRIAQAEALAQAQNPQAPVAAQPAAPAPAAAPAGFQFMTDRGRQAGFGSNASGFITADPNAQYRMWDERGKNKIVASGTGFDALQNIYNTANQFNTEQGKKANWGIERLNPTTGRWERVAENDPAKNVVGKIADVALPVAGAFLLPGVGGVLGGALGAGLGAAGGSALSSVAQGRSLEDTLLRAAISGVASGGASAIGGAPFIPASAPSGAGGALAGSALGAGTMGLTGAKLAGLLPEIVVPGVSGSVGAGIGAGIGAGVGAVGGAALSGGSAMDQSLPAESEIVVETARPAPLDSFAPQLAASLGASAAPVLPDMTQTPVNVPNPSDRSLLDDIIKYYSLGSAGLDLLGGALGGGGGGAGQMTPYVSQLGPMPTFARGAMTPFGGDYETYGFGPEFNFFGGAPAPAPTAPAFGLLPPAAQPERGMV
jgi:hypothetical protein